MSDDHVMGYIREAGRALDPDENLMERLGERLAASGYAPITPIPEVETTISVDDSGFRKAVEGNLQKGLEFMAGNLLADVAGLDVTGPHGADTPRRFIQMLRELTTPEQFEFTTFPAQSQNMIVIRDIPFSSVCSHHVIPFVGYAHVAYVPDEKIAGLSKFARLVRAQARKLQVQETLTMEIADIIDQVLQPLGVGVVMEAEHLCMTIRGVQAPGAKTRTAEMRGVFSNHEKTAKAEFLSAINSGH